MRVGLGLMGDLESWRLLARGWVPYVGRSYNDEWEESAQSEGVEDMTKRAKTGLTAVSDEGQVTAAVVGGVEASLVLQAGAENEILRARVQWCRAYSARRSWRVVARGVSQHVH